ncbi:hypothetical protein EVAR_33076_1 [Eumeta japonica]|uniref:Uncharacterized protein n=1 Tax=Eumeta variegata TaxID=151549 RepID=A0A4C2A880_EUMVA|nr:hypothetical protein EVAR_33076_1 [Eumeta japonica]
MKLAALKLKQQRMNVGIVNQVVLETLQKIIREYNIKYRTTLVLNNNFDIVNEEVIETIDLENDGLSNRNKKQKLSQPMPSEEYLEHLNAIKLLAVRLKTLASKNNLCAKDKRAFSKLLKTFNNTHKSDVYINDEYEICDRRHIVLDSSSDSDCILEDSTPKSKKLRNPFNILRQLSLETKNLVDAVPSTSSEQSTLSQDINEASTPKMLNEHWCPNEDDFGHGEVVPNKTSQLRIDDSKKMDYLYSFIIDFKTNFDNWIDLKICFWDMVKHNADVINEECKKLTQQSSSSNDKNAFVMPKRYLIKPYKDVSKDTHLKVHFDVYERDVQNFRKSQRPSPHFRIICLE